ncbi:unnamed protein product [Parascedosporium putredinis]|uniref:Gcp-like domain-containing protein n=1 Tax=Parascedosporium putredinis TaxID=1442378 RepID=A0A9P1H4I9_9PEZI|nr:unnamed protein product [Parascedosporium putredinis]CAI7998321.1 unnamed protein product [Parascedosporium putredinis]
MRLSAGANTRPSPAPFFFFSHHATTLVGYAPPGRAPRPRSDPPRHRDHCCRCHYRYRVNASKAARPALHDPRHRDLVRRHLRRHPYHRPLHPRRPAPLQRKAHLRQPPVPRRVSPAALDGHASSLAGLVSEALRTTTTTVTARPDLVAVTRGPGMSANLAEGLALAKDDRDSPPTAQLQPGPTPAFPFLTLLVSGGHTQLVHSRSLTDHRILANSANIALGDALDKPLPSPATADRDLAAYVAPVRRADEIAPTPPPRLDPPPPLASSRRLAYEFSALQSHVQSVLALRPNLPLTLRRALAYDVMRLAFEHLAGRVLLALAADPSLASHASALVVSGGVASNRFLATVLRSMLDARGFPISPRRTPAPPLHRQRRHDRLDRLGDAPRRLRLFPRCARAQKVVRRPHCPGRRDSWCRRVASQSPWQLKAGMRPVSQVPA